MRFESRTRPRTGFTIIEVVVALTLLALGALAVVAASAAAVSAVGDSGAQLAAMFVARSRLEALASQGCVGDLTGTATDSATGIREWWQITVSRHGLRLATDSVVYLDHGDPRSIVRQRLIVC